MRVSLVPMVSADIGHHCRDYFLAQWDRFRDLPRGELAHSTYRYGASTFDPVRGEERRARVTLATAISEAMSRQANLGYVDPATIDVAARETGSSDLTGV